MKKFMFAVAFATMIFAPAVAFAERGDFHIGRDTTRVGTSLHADGTWEPCVGCGSAEGYSAQLDSLNTGWTYAAGLGKFREITSVVSFRNLSNDRVIERAVTKRWGKPISRVEITYLSGGGGDGGNCGKESGISGGHNSR